MYCIIRIIRLPDKFHNYIELREMKINNNIFIQTEYFR